MLEFATTYLGSQANRDKALLERFERKQEDQARDAERGGIEVEEEEEEELTPEQIDLLKERVEKAEAQLSQIGEAINQRFVQSDPVEQAWSVLFLPQSDEGRRLFAPAFDLAQRSDDPLVRVVYLSIHVGDPEATALTDAMGHSDQRISEYAVALKTAFDAAIAQRQAAQRR